MLQFLRNLVYIDEIDGKTFRNIKDNNDGILKKIFYFDEFDNNLNIKQYGGDNSVKIKSPTYVNPKACSPSNAEVFKENNTCFTQESLKLIANSINDYDKTTKIKNIDSKSTKELWKEIKMQMKGCNNEWCWLSKSFLKKLKNDKSFRNTFKIPIPDGKYEWLTTDDIEFTINQFIPLVDKSTFLGAVPIDFATFSATKENFSSQFMKTLIKKGIRNIGVVFNTDPHTKGGKHWVSLFIKLSSDGKKGNAYYYDSFGVNSPAEVRKWVDDFPIPLTYKYNTVQHQFDNSECGVYSIHFIVRMLFDWSFERITTNIIKDVEMNAKRKEYFNPFL